MLPPEDGPHQLLERARDLRRPLAGSSGMRSRIGSSGDAAVGEVRHGEGPGSYGGVELALEGLELEGVVERAATVPDDGLWPLELDREPLRR